MQLDNTYACCGGRWLANFPFLYPNDINAGKLDQVKTNLEKLLVPNHYGFAVAILNQNQQSFMEPLLEEQGFMLARIAMNPGYGDKSRLYIYIHVKKQAPEDVALIDKTCKECEARAKETLKEVVDKEVVEEKAAPEVQEQPKFTHFSKWIKSRFNTEKPGSVQELDSSILESTSTTH